MVDGSLFAERLVSDITKPLTEGTSTTDVHALLTIKPLTDVVNSVEDHAFILTRKLRESFTAMTDEAAMHTGKALSHTSELSDTEYLNVGKVLEEASTLSDDQYHVVYKALTDALTATDDWDGEASILDDQEMIFHKQRKEITTVDDEIFIHVKFFRQFLDTAQTTDIAALATNKLLQDTGLISESRYTATNKGLSEVSAVQDATAHATHKFTADTSTLTETHSFTLLKRISDEVSVAQEFGLVRDRATQPTETASFSDTGRLISQGYVSDATYFADDYVGASRTF